MADPRFILHHYESSPYAEKIRLLLGRGQQTWGSVLSPAMPPRPNIDPLSGGYRRIPIAQVGADIFCDTAIISLEIAGRSSQSAMTAASVTDDMSALVERAESEVFFSAIAGVKPLKLIATLLRLFGPFGMIRFVKDRGRMMKSGTVRPAQGDKATAIFDHFLADLDAMLASKRCLSGDEPGYADFTVYHPIWLNALVTGNGIDANYAQVSRWYQQVAGVGHGSREELDAATAFSEAKDNEPRPVPESESHVDYLHTQVMVAPTDYGCEAVEGVLVAQTPDRWIVARDTDEFGTVHVHFPRHDYAVTPK